jgi:hypothetical protein
MAEKNLKVIKGSGTELHFQMSKELGEKAPDSSFQFGTGLFGGEKPFEQSQIGIDGDVFLSDFDDAFNGSAQKTGFGIEREIQDGAIPSSFFVHNLQWEDADTAKQIVKRSIDGSHDFLFWFVMGNGDPHSGTLLPSFFSRTHPVGDSALFWR